MTIVSVARRMALAALLLGLATVSVPAYAQSVYFQVCNAGKVDVDVFVSGAGKVSSSHVGSADCATVAAADIWSKNH